MVAFFLPNPSRLLLIELYSRNHQFPSPWYVVVPYEWVRDYVIDSLRLSTTQILQPPSNIVVTIAATRMYRLLVQYGSDACKALPSYCFLFDNADCCHNCSSQLETHRGSGRTLSDVRCRSGPIELNRMEVSGVRTEHEQYPTSQMSRADPFIVTGIIDSQGDYKAQEVTLNGDLESRPEK